MALTSRTGSHLLPCGRDLDDIWQRLNQPLDAHEQSCPHCQTARSSLHALAEAAQAVRDDQSLLPPPGLHHRIMSAVRAELRRSSRLPLPAGEWGPVEISMQAVATVLRFAADSVPGVRARRCQLSPIDPPPASDQPPTGAPAFRSPADPVRYQVELSLSVALSRQSLLTLVEAVRARVAAAADAQIGLEIDRINVDIEDVYDPPMQPGTS